jgi:hypothetical protein
VSQLWGPRHRAHRVLAANADATGDARSIDELTYLSWLGGWFFPFIIH